jgi:Leucine-rich repeat (LRR) protein
LNILERRLSGLPDLLFRNLTNLRELRLSGDRIRTMNSGLFANLTSLSSIALISLDFSQNGSESAGLQPGIFDTLTALTNFSFTGAGIETFPESLFARNANLQRLDFPFLTCSSRRPCRIALPKFVKNVASLQVPTKIRLISVCGIKRVNFV